MMLENFCNFVRYSNSMVIKTHPYFSEIHIEAGRKLHDIHVMICYITLQEIKRTDSPIPSVTTLFIVFPLDLFPHARVVLFDLTTKGI